MIRIVSLEPFDEGDLTFLCRTLYQAYGLGTEPSGERKVPSSTETGDGRVQAEKLLEAAGGPRLVADDKILYLTGADLALRPGPLGEPPCWGFAQFGGERAVVSTRRLPPRGATEASIETWRRRLAREAIHFVGHLWHLHHCYDSRCAMHPSWSQGLSATPDMDLCSFCREKSEQKIRFAKT